MALPYVAWLVSGLWLHVRHSPKRSSMVAIGAILSVILVVQCLVCSSNYYASREFNHRSDQLVASTIAAAIIQSKQSEPQAVTRFASQGALERVNPYKVAWYSTAGSSFFSWDNGNSERMIRWLMAMGIGKLKAIPTTELINYAPRFSRMPAWPSPGSIVIQGNAVLVKFGEPSPTR